MDQRLADVLSVLNLEQVEINLFRGESRDIGSPQVFGGQVLGQALVAAYNTVSGRACHSLHAYFVRRGDFNAPIVYQVDRSRDGASFTTRRVVAIQHGEQLFHMSCSFQIDEPGMEHSATMPDVPAPEGLSDFESYGEQVLAELPEGVRRFFERRRPFEFRPVQIPNYINPERSAPCKATRTRGARTINRIQQPFIHAERSVKPHRMINTRHLQMHERLTMRQCRCIKQIVVRYVR